jgi:hypothetical protein
MSRTTKTKPTKLTKPPTLTTSVPVPTFESLPEMCTPKHAMDFWQVGRNTAYEVRARHHESGDGRDQREADRGFQ